MNATGKMPWSVIFRTGPLTVEDYREAIKELEDAIEQFGHPEYHCTVCGDSGHGAKMCHHNPLVAARQWAAATSVYQCYHCGFIATTDEEARGHFGANDIEDPACFNKQEQGE